MKKIILIIILVTSNNFYSQNNSILNNQLKINNILLGLPENILIDNFGIIEPPIDYFNELTNETYLEYSINNNKFYFNENTLIDFSLNNSQFYFMSPSIKVGNSILLMSNLYPLSYNNREVVDNLGFITIDIKLNDGSNSDVFIVITYNPQTKIITSICKSEY
jgi:hypothetical protein